MPQFALHKPTRVTITNVNVRSEKHGDEHVPAADLKVKWTTGNDALGEFHPLLKAMFYKPAQEAPEQPELDGVDAVSDMPLLRCPVLEPTIKLNTEGIGYRVEIDRGLGGPSNILLTDTKINRFAVALKEGGSVEITWTIQASKLTEDQLGKLAAMIDCETQITAVPPPPDAPLIDGTTEAFKADHPDAGDMFAAAHGMDDAFASVGEDPGPGDDDGSDSEGGEPDVQQEPARRSRRRGVAAVE